MRGGVEEEGHEIWGRGMCLNSARLAFKHMTTGQIVDARIGNFWDDVYEREDRGAGLNRI